MEKAGRRRWRVWHFIALAVLGLAIIGGGIVAVVTAMIRPVVTASDSFMTALQNGDFQSAYRMGTPELRTEVGSAERLGAMFEPGRPASWSWNQRQVKNGTGSVSGRVTYSSGGESDVAIFLLPEGDEWRISDFRMNPQ